MKYSQVKRLKSLVKDMKYEAPPKEVGLIAPQRSVCISWNALVARLSLFLTLLSRLCFPTMQLSHILLLVGMRGTPVANLLTDKNLKLEYLDALACDAIMLLFLRIQWLIKGMHNLQI